MRVWVTRDKTKNGDVAVWDGYEKDLFINDINGRWESEFGTDTVEIEQLYEKPKYFKRLFGFTPRKGSCKQMELSLSEI